MNEEYSSQIKKHKADCLLSYGYSEEGANQIANNELPTDPVDRAVIGAWFDNKHITGEQKKELFDSTDPRVYNGNGNQKNNEETQSISAKDIPTQNNAK